MERRKFLIGVGSAAVGGSALVGSSAMSIQNRDREMTVDVVSDDSGIINYNVGQAPDPIVDIDSDGRFRVDFGAATGDGVNVDSVVDVGRDYNSPLNGDNITIENHSSRDFDNVKYEFEAGSNFSSSDPGTYLGISVASAQDSDKLETDETWGPGDSGSIIVDGFGAGENQQMNLRVSTMGADLDDDLSGTLTISTDYDGF